MKFLQHFIIDYEIERGEIKRNFEGTCTHCQSYYTELRTACYINYTKCVYKMGLSTQKMSDI